MWKFILFVSAFLPFVTWATDADNELLVSTSSGLVQGHYNVAGVREWKGVPYAKPPVGSLRWQYPQPTAPWNETYDASFDAPGCPQECKLPPGNCPEYGISEDCLYLTVTSPTAPPTNGGYPVFFWIHGGAFEQGLGNCALYNATQFALDGVVSVVINYRLGALGFMASTSMQGNYGFMDQRLAMEWTQLNIRNFGGDPTRVTLAGQSAGAMSAGCHLVSPGSEGLFSKVIQESNPLGLPFHDRSSAAKNANMMADYLGCEHDDVDCLMGKSSDEIVDAQNHAIKLNLNNLFLNFLPFAPMVENGGEIPEQPLYALAHGNFSPMPMFGGSLYDEGQLFVYELFPKPLSKTEYKAIVDGLFGIKTGKKVMELYPYDLVPNADDGRQTFNVLATDLLFFCPFRNVTVGYQRALGKTAMSTYIYRFRHVLSFDCWGENYTFCVGYCCHGSELPFVFNVFTDGVSVAYEPTAEEVALTGDLSIAWSNFISSGDPNKGVPVALKYPLYDYDEDAIIILDEPGMSIQVHVRDKYCDLWDEIGYFY